jgi:hypothetical protein
VTTTESPAIPGLLEPHETGFGYWYDPDQIAIDANIRTDAEESVDADPEMIASVKAGGGNHTPAQLVLTEGGRLRAWKGNRRVIACRRTRTRLWAFHVPEGTSKDERVRWITEQVSENEDRLGLRPRDCAVAVLALFDLGVTPAGVRKRLPRLSKEEIAAAREIRDNPFAAAAADEHPDWTLDMDATVGQFAAGDDPEAVAALEAAAGPGEFAHVAAQMRATAGERAARRAAAGPYEDAGFRVAASCPAWQRLDRLRDDDDNELTEEGHRECPGRGVVITQDWEWPETAEQAYRQEQGLGPDDDIQFDNEEDAQAAGYVLTWRAGPFFCADPTNNGHHFPSGRPSERDKTEEDKEAERERARLVRANNKLWYAATEVRADHLRGLAGRPQAPAGSELFVLATLLGLDYDRAFRDALDRGHEIAADLLGMPERFSGGAKAIWDKFSGAPDKKRRVVLLVLALAAYEKPCRDPHTWQNGGHLEYLGARKAAGPSAIGRYLAFLESTGYELSKLERDVADPPVPGGEPEPGPERGPEPEPAGEPADIAPAPGEVDRGGGTDPDPARLARLVAEHEDATWRPEVAGEQMCQDPDGCPNGPEPHAFVPDDGRPDDQVLRDGWYPCCVQPGEQNGQAS